MRATRPQAHLSLNDSSFAAAHNTPLPLKCQTPDSVKRLVRLRCKRAASDLEADRDAHREIVCHRNRFHDRDGNIPDSARGLRQQESCTVPRQVKRFHSVHVTLAWVMAEKGIGLSPTARVIGNPKRL